MVVCNQETIPMVEHAEYTISSQLPGNNRIILPGSTNVTYRCKEGNAMSGMQNTVQCVYHKQKRENDSDNELVPAIWDGHRNISCRKGIGITSIKPKRIILGKKWCLPDYCAGVCFILS